MKRLGVGSYKTSYILRLSQIDHDASMINHRAVVKRGVNVELDAMKQTYEGMGDLLEETAKKIASEISEEHNLDLNVIYFPQIGFLVTIPANNIDGLVEEGSLDEGKWERMFTSNDRVYYKDFRTKEMDETLGDIWALICGKSSLVLNVSGLATH